MIRSSRGLLWLLTGLALCLSLALGSVTAQPAPAQIQGADLFVRDTPGGFMDCSTWADACDLQTALNKAGEGMTIWVAAGTYRPDTIDREISFAIGAGVEVYGGFPAAGGEWEERDWETHKTYLSGDIHVPEYFSDNSYHVVTFTEAGNASVLDGFNIIRGNADGSYPFSAGGGILLTHSSPTLKNLSIFNNEAIFNGGGLMNYSSSSPYLENVKFDSNRAAYGAGMYVSSGSPELDHVDFYDNVATENGGGMNIQSSSGVSLDTCIFDGNQAQQKGGGIYNNQSSPGLKNVTFTTNHANDCGGAIYNYQYSSPSLLNVVFGENDADQNGGGMTNYNNSNPTLTEVEFTNNSAKVNGGGMANVVSQPTLDNVSFSGNVAAWNGGGMYNDTSTVMMTKVAFSRNRTGLGEIGQQNGGAMYSTLSTVEMNMVTFSLNSADDYGGAMCNFQTDAHIVEGEILSNTATKGGGVSNHYCDPSFENVNFSSNTATLYGGGMFNVNSSPWLETVGFNENSAGVSGGGMWNESFSKPDLHHVRFWQNATSSDVPFCGGGGMGNLESDPILKDVFFWANESEHSGGGMYNEGSQPTMERVTFLGNSAVYYGGGVFNMSGSSPVLTNSTLAENEAYYGGGMLNMTASNPVLTNVTIYANTAHLTGAFGGGIHNDGTSGVVMTSSLLWGNLPDAFTGGTMTITYSDVEGGLSGTGNINGEPHVGSLESCGECCRVYPILLTSPLIDTADPHCALVSDQRGYFRPIDGDGNGSARCDMGAYEYASSPLWQAYLPFVLLITTTK